MKIVPFVSVAMTMLVTAVATGEMIAGSFDGTADTVDQSTAYGVGLFSVAPDVWSYAQATQFTVPAANDYYYLESFTVALNTSNPDGTDLSTFSFRIVEDNANSPTGVTISSGDLSGTANYLFSEPAFTIVTTSASGMLQAALSYWLILEPKAGNEAAIGWNHVWPGSFDHETARRWARGTSIPEDALWLLHSASGMYSDTAFTIGANVVPLPGAFLLGTLGLGVAGIKLRRSK